MIGRSQRVVPWRQRSSYGWTPWFGTKKSRDSKKGFSAVWVHKKPKLRPGLEDHPECSVAFKKFSILLDSSTTSQICILTLSDWNGNVLSIELSRFITVPQRRLLPKGWHASRVAGGKRLASICKGLVLSAKANGRIYLLAPLRRIVKPLAPSCGWSIPSTSLTATKRSAF